MDYQAHHIGPGLIYGEGGRDGRRTAERGGTPRRLGGEGPRVREQVPIRIGAAAAVQGHDVANIRRLGRSGVGHRCRVENVKRSCATLIDIHCHATVRTVGIARPTGEGRTRIGSSGEGDSCVAEVALFTVPAAGDSRWRAGHGAGPGTGRGHGERDVRKRRRAALIGIHRHAAIRTVGIARSAGEDKAWIGFSPEGDDRVDGIALLTVRATRTAADSLWIAEYEAGRGPGAGDVHAEGIDQGKCRRAALINIHRHAAIRTVGIARPAGEGGTRSGGSLQSNDGIMGVILATVRTTVDPSRIGGYGAGPRTGEVYMEGMNQGKCRRARLMGVHRHTTIRTVGIARVSVEDDTRIGGGGEGNDGIVGVAFATVPAAVDPARVAGHSTRAGTAFGDHKVKF